MLSSFLPCWLLTWISRHNYLMCRTISTLSPRPDLQHHVTIVLRERQPHHWLGLVQDLQCRLALMFVQNLRHGTWFSSPQWAQLGTNWITETCWVVAACVQHLWPQNVMESCWNSVTFVVIIIIVVVSFSTLEALGQCKPQGQTWKAGSDSCRVLRKASGGPPIRTALYEFPFFSESLILNQIH